MEGGMGRRKDPKEVIDEIFNPRIPKPKGTIQSGLQNVSIQGNYNKVEQHFHLDTLSKANKKKLTGMLNEWADLYEKAYNVDTQTAMKTVRGIFKKKFGLTRYDDLPASRFDEAIRFIIGQIEKLERFLLKKGYEGTPKHKKILKVHRLRSFLCALEEADFIRLLQKNFGKINLAEFSVKELDKLIRILSDLRNNFSNLSKYL